MKNSLNQNFNQNNQKTLNWEQIQEDFKIKFGKGVFVPIFLSEQLGRAVFGVVAL